MIAPARQSTARPGDPSSRASTAFPTIVFEHSLSAENDSPRIEKFFSYWDPAAVWRNCYFASWRATASRQTHHSVVALWCRNVVERRAKGAAGRPCGARSPGPGWEGSTAAGASTCPPTVVTCAGEHQNPRRPSDWGIAKLASAQPPNSYFRAYVGCPPTLAAVRQSPAHRGEVDPRSRHGRCWRRAVGLPSSTDVQAQER